jgi:hypothetical protein
MSKAECGDVEAVIRCEIAIGIVTVSRESVHRNFTTLLRLAETLDLVARPQMRIFACL